jgi:hypothetical protein
MITVDRVSPGRRRRREAGIVLIITTLALLFLVIPTVGLAIDGGVLYTIKAKLQTATDGAALAAARSLSREIDPLLQQTSATNTATKFFNANINNGWMGLTTPQIVVTFPPAPPKTTIVRIDSNVTAPTYFMRLFGISTITVRAAGAANRRDVNIMMVLDRSRSLDISGSCDDLREAAKSFVDAFVDGRDRIGMATFGTTYRVDFPPAFDFRSRAGTNLPTMINNIFCIGGTNAAAAYWQGYLQLNALNEPGTLNVILFFTDGQPNTLHMPALEVKSSSSCTNKSDKVGVITPAGSQVWGIFLPVEVNPPPAPNPDYRLNTANVNTSCSYASSYQNVPNDIVALTKIGAANEVDAFGNLLYGYKSVLRDGSGRIRINDAGTITNAGTNALDSAASRVRSLSATSNLNIVTYAIGLGGTGAAEDALMNRIANTTASAIYDSTKPTGTYVYAANAAALQQAFAQIAADILRLSL